MKELETIILIGGVAVVGFLIYKNLSGTSAAAASTASTSSGNPSNGLLTTIFGQVSSSGSGLATNLDGDVSSLIGDFTS